MKKLTLLLLAICVLASSAMASPSAFTPNSYVTKVDYTIVNNSAVNLVGIDAHTTSNLITVRFPINKSSADTNNMGVADSKYRMCVGIGINNFSDPYVGARALTGGPCSVTVKVNKVTDTNYKVIISDSK